jgi:hypothetical protein
MRFEEIYKGEMAQARRENFCKNLFFLASVQK